MNPMYQAMMNQSMDPVAAQQQQLAQYQPAQVAPAPQMGQMGMSLGQMMGQAGQNRDKRIDDVHRVLAESGGW